MKRWIGAIILSVVAHALVFFCLFYQKEVSIKNGGFTGDIRGEFNSVMIVSDLPVGKLQKSAPLLQQSQDEPSKEAEDKKSDSSSLSNSLNESDIKVQKADKISAKPSPNRVKELSKSVKKETKKIHNQTSSIAQNSSSAKDNSASSPIMGSSTLTSSPLDSSGVNGQKSSWQGEVVSHLNRHKRYPNQALIQKQEGVVKIRVKIDINGNVLLVSPLSELKFRLLNDEAIELFKRASPLPKPPNSLANSGTIVFEIPIEFNIKKYSAQRGMR